MSEGMKLTNRIIFVPSVIIILLGSIGLFIIDFQIHAGMLDRAKLELEWLAKSAITTVSLAEKQLTIKQLDPIAKALHQASGARITLIDDTGAVLADSNVAYPQVASLANHLDREEIRLARLYGIGHASRYSDTLKQEFIYLAVYQEIERSDGMKSIYSRASFSTETFQKQVMQMRFALLSMLTLGVIVITLFSAFALRIISASIKHDKNFLEAEVAARNDEIELMHELDSILSTCSELTDAKEVIKKLLPTLLEGSYGAISIYKSSRNKLCTKLFWGENWQEKKYFSPNQCWALRKGHQHTFNQKVKGISCEHFTQLEENSSICIPLIAHGETIGVMHMVQASLTETNSLLAGAIAKKIGLAIANIELKSSLRQQAIKDALTNLYNRRYLFETLEQLVARSKRHNSEIGIIMVDIDHFKKLNDNYGHDAGDKVLQQLSYFFQSITRSCDIVCRYGGEEFCVVCPETSKEETFLIANKLCIGIDKLTITANETTQITATISAGVAVYPTDNGSIEDIISLADKALYQAKHAGRNCVRCDKSNS